MLYVRRGNEVTRVIDEAPSGVIGMLHAMHPVLFLTEILPVTVFGKREVHSMEQARHM